MPDWWRPGPQRHDFGELWLVFLWCALRALQYSRRVLRRIVSALFIVVACKEQPSGSPPPAATAPAATPATTAATTPVNAPASELQSSTSGPVTAQSGPPQPSLLEKLQDGRSGLGPFSFEVPSGWTETATLSKMRVAEFHFDAGASVAAELLAYYFGEKGNGSREDAMNHWLTPFQQPDGRSPRSAAKVEESRFAGQDAVVFSVTGTFVRPALPGLPGKDEPDQALVGAIVESPRGPYYFRVSGPRAAVEAATPSFRALLASLRVR
jgi:hypothetical protein